MFQHRRHARVRQRIKIQTATTTVLKVTLQSLERFVHLRSINWIRFYQFINQLSAYDTLLCHDVLLCSMRMTLIGVMKFFCYNAYDKLILHL